MEMGGERESELELSERVDSFASETDQVVQKKHAREIKREPRFQRKMKNCTKKIWKISILTVCKQLESQC